METAIERAESTLPAGIPESGYRAGVTALAMMSDLEFETRLKALKSGQTRLQQIHRNLMVEGIDFGTIPGTPKPTLFKSGAEKLCQFYGLVPCFDHEITYGDGATTPPINVISRCALHVGSDRGPSVAQATGACSSFEKKYRYRRGERACPACGLMGALLKSKQQPEWFCWAKKGGCGATFPERAPEIINQPQGDIDNPDPFELLNTIIKMADKRALVACALMATATSGLYTQDMEDSAPAAHSDEAPRETPANGSGGNGAAKSNSSAAPAADECPECKWRGGKHQVKCSQHQKPGAAAPAANGKAADAGAKALQSLMGHVHGVWAKWCKREGHDPNDEEFLRSGWADLIGQSFASRNDLTREQLELISARLNALLQDGEIPQDDVFSDQ